MYSVLVPFDEDEQRATAQGEMVRRLADSADGVEATLLHVGSVGDPLSIPAGAQLRDALVAAGVDVRVETRDGDPVDAILEVAEEYAADSIVVGGRKRSSVGQLLFGSVSQGVILRADRPVTVTGSETKEDPSHRCRDCGEAYYTDPDAEIPTCRNCGGTGVEPVDSPTTV